ncbi:hypothetical protein PAPHI01_1989 [Pancytospora philotis]|nr:hypothetical protein PAPHI01_1989 [Pancytospora philotis]
MADESVQKPGENAEDAKAKAARYKESEVIKKFLDSRAGIPFLLNPRALQSTSRPLSRRDGDDIYARIDEYIDLYTSWTSNFPVRKNLRVSKYEFLKSVENFCSKSEINQKYADQLNEGL